MASVEQIVNELEDIKKRLLDASAATVSIGDLARDTSGQSAALSLHDKAAGLTALEGEIQRFSEQITGLTEGLNSIIATATTLMGSGQSGSGT